MVVMVAVVAVVKILLLRVLLLRILWLLLSCRCIGEAEARAFLETHTL